MAARPGYMPRISFATPELLWKVLTAKRWELLKVLCGAGPVSILSAGQPIFRRKPPGPIEMVRRSEFLDLALEQMRGVADLRVRAMFGGYGVYVQDRIFAIIIDDRLYLKADAASRLNLAAKGATPFSYVRRGKSVTTSYFEAPAEVFEDVRVMQAKVQQALQCAERSGRKPANPALQRTRKKPRAA